MKRILLCAIATTFISSPTIAREPTDQEVIALVERGVALMKEQGKSELIKQIRAANPELRNGVLFIKLRDLSSGFVIAQPYNTIPEDRGWNLKDLDGKPYVNEILYLSRLQGRGWVKYHFLDQNLENTRRKVYFERADDSIVEVHLRVYPS